MTAEVQRQFGIPPLALGRKHETIVVFEDKEIIREDLEKRLLDRSWTAIPEAKDWNECVNWARKHVRFFILDIAIEQNPSAGLYALDGIKEIAPESFCAVVTEDVNRIKHTAWNLKADYICGKSEADLDLLFQTLDELPASLSEREQARLSHSQILEVCRRVDVLLESGAVTQAEHELVRLEPPLARAFDLESLGDNFSTVVDALRLALVNQPGRGLSASQWAVWKEVTDASFGPGLTLDVGTMLGFSRKLRDGGWVIDPPNFGVLAEFLVGSHDEE